MKITTNNSLNKLIQLIKAKLDELSQMVTNSFNSINGQISTINTTLSSKPSIDDVTPSATSVFSSQKTDTLLSAKANSTHSHSINDITNLQNTLDSKANSSHIHSEYATKEQVGNLNYKALSQSEYDGLATKDANTIYFIYED